MKKRGEREIEMIHFENKELSGDEEDGESNDARNSSKKRRRGTILKLTHRRIDYFGPQLLSHYYIKMRRRISRRHGDAKQARENQLLFPSWRQKSTARILSSIIQIERRRRRNGERKPEVVAFARRSARSAMVRT